MLQPYFFQRFVRTDHDNYDLAWGPGKGPQDHFAYRNANCYPGWDTFIPECIPKAPKIVVRFRIPGSKIRLVRPGGAK